MSGSNLRRSTILGLTLCLCLLPLASAHAAPRDHAGKTTITSTIQQFGRTLIQMLARAGTGNTAAITPPPPPPGGGNGIGIDPNGGFKP
jgi:hypothetical protein